jgi:CheY-like chemotaxis protein
MPKILIVDDDKDVVDSTRALLETAGYAAVSAFSGEEGYAKALVEKPDLMLLDVMMAHDSEGFEIARRLHENADTKDLPVIIMTGIRRAKHLPFRFEPDEDWLPVKAVMEKPVRPDALLKQIESALGSKP